jgi:N-acetylglutamate synthase-like GNAT family acetyltransferase
MATPDDANDVKAAHYYAYQISYKGYLPDDYLKSMSFDKEIIERTANYIKEHEYYVAENDGRVIGFASLTYPEEGTVEIQALYIHPDFQKRGAGSALMKEVCSIKKKQGYKKLVLWTMREGPSLNFYQKQGMKKSSSVKEKLWKLNIPIICLEKNL